MLKYILILLVFGISYAKDHPELKGDLKNVFMYNHLDLGSFEYFYGRSTDKDQKIIKSKSLITGDEVSKIVTISTYYFKYNTHGDITIKVLSEDNLINEIAVKIDRVWKTWY